MAKFPAKENILHQKHSLQKTLAIPTSLSQVKKLVQEKPQPLKEVRGENNGQPPTEAPVTPQLNHPFNKASVQELLEDVLQDYKKLGKSMEIAVVKQPFEIDQEKIVFFLQGELQKDIFIKLKPELTGFLKRGLQNHSLEISFEIREEVANRASKLYTSTDKLRYLKEKSPALKELQQRFGLETDF